MANVSAIKLPNNTTYNIVDKTSGYTKNTGTITKIQTTAGAHTTIDVSSGAATFNIPTKTSDLTNDSGFITSYTDEKLKWTASTSSNTYYPLQSTSTATTSTANTLNGINFYQYYNTAGGYRRLNLGNSTAYKSTGGAYGTIRLYGAAATYYGDLVPGVLGTTTGDGHISANRTWTLPDKTGTIALISDIPDVSSFITDAGVTKITTTAGTHSVITNATGAVSFNVPTTAAHVGAATSDHTHGNITNSGDITATAPTIANGDQIIINDNSTSKITNGPTFDGSTTTTALTPKGTWETFSKFSGSYNDLSDKPTIPSITLNGNSTTSPSFYAPTSAGTSGYYLKSSGSGAPTWNSFPTIVNTRGTATSGGTTLSVVNTGDMYTWNNKQDTLVSGTNIKTINNESLLGSGNISITGTDTKVKLTSNTGSTSIPLVLGPTSITSGTAYECLYNTSLSYTPSTQALVAGKSVQVDSWKWDGATTFGHFSLVYVS